MLDAEIHLRVLLGEIGEIGAEHNAILYAASLGDSQQTLDRPNVIFFIRGINRGGEFHTLIHARRKNKAIATRHLLPQLIVAHSQVIPQNDFHLLRDRSAFRQGGQGDAFDLMPAGDEILSPFFN